MVAWKQNKKILQKQGGREIELIYSTETEWQGNRTNIVYRDMVAGKQK